MLPCNSLRRMPRAPFSRLRYGQRGFTMIEMLAALALAAMMIAGITVLINSSLEDTRALQAARYQSVMATAARQLIQQNDAALTAQATTTTPVVVNLNGSPYQLSSYLSNAMNNENAYGQTPCLLIYPATTTGALQALLVTEGGQTIPDSELGYIAANSGTGGGSIPVTNNSGGAAMGAYGSWTVPAPNPAGASCSGTKTGPGHLASLVYYNGTQAQNSDYLYRVGVPGDPAANTMEVPIILANQTDYAACTTSGAVAADTLGNVLDCQAGVWEPQASYHWRGPVADAAALSTLQSPTAGDVAMTLATNRAYTYTGQTWQALAVDEQGILALGNMQTEGSACAPTAASTTPVSTDATGRVLSCQNGTWQTQSEIEPASSQTACTIIMASPGADDYPTCTPPPSTNYYASPFTYNSTNGTFSYTYSIPVTLTKPGVIVASTWAHMNDGTCSARPYAAEAQLSQSVDIYENINNTNTDIGHTESQGPTLTNDSGGINNSLTQSGTAGTYSVVVTTNWATYAGVTTPWTSSFCGENGTVVANTPIAAGWSINSYY
jgi:prepilin-type N-terminal cleavage/methylation domain-containing protein